jgi:DNA polymerase
MKDITKSPRIDYDFPSKREGFRGLAIVGEAPGAEEVRLGHPFVGRSGQLLDTVLVKAGIDRRTCLVANVFRFQPPGNKVDHFFSSRAKAKREGVAIEEKYGKFGSNYVREEFVSEIEHLSMTLQALKPAAIISLGRTPLWALTGMSGLLSIVGKPLQSRMVENIPVIPTYHPSFILRGNWGLQDDWVRHLVVANQYVV